MVAQLWRQTKTHWIVYFKRGNFLVSELHLKGKKSEMASLAKPHSTPAPQSHRFLPVWVGPHGCAHNRPSWGGQRLPPNFQGLGALGAIASSESAKVSPQQFPPTPGISLLSPHPPSRTSSLVSWPSPYLSSKRWRSSQTTRENLLCCLAASVLTWILFCSYLPCYYQRNWVQETPQEQAWWVLIQKAISGNAKGKILVFSKVLTNHSKPWCEIPPAMWLLSHLRSQITV